jgi:aerobic-type carbon monoxide dehydrogenase small subunit (CoxS/CutS family)
MQKLFRLRVNGKPCSVTTDPDRPLLEVLREDLGLTGTKYGCGEGQCRACTVLMDGEPTLSCRVKVSAADNKEIRTIEGLEKDGKLHPVQEAFFEEEAFQCGYCTPGMVLETVALLEKDPKATKDRIIGALERHLCRCCNYPRIASAIGKATNGATV